MSICLSVCLLTCLSVCLFVCLSVCLSVCLFVCLFVYLFVCLFVYLVCLSYLSVYLSVCLSICLSFSLSVCLSLCLSVCLSVCLLSLQEKPLAVRGEKRRMAAKPKLASGDGRAVQGKTATRHRQKSSHTPSTRLTHLAGNQETHPPSPSPTPSPPPPLPPHPPPSLPILHSGVAPPYCVPVYRYSASACDPSTGIPLAVPSGDRAAPHTVGLGIPSCYRAAPHTAGLDVPSGDRAAPNRVTQPCPKAYFYPPIPSMLPAMHMPTAIPLGPPRTVPSQATLMTGLPSRRSALNSSPPPQPAPTSSPPPPPPPPPSLPPPPRPVTTDVCLQTSFPKERERMTSHFVLEVRTYGVHTTLY